ncbi:MAG: dUTP pyrophosphatase [Acidobacteriota bacterium]|nr:dUTP pyrophosphatase [Acidobacteriota bacterium]
MSDEADRAHVVANKGEPIEEFKRKGRRRMFERLRFKRLHPAARLPTRGSAQAAGLDLCAVEHVTIEVGGRAAVRTGLAVEIPAGFYGRIAPRSGLAVRHGLDVLAGVIDPDYRGEILCALVNHGEEPFEVEPGARIAQLVIVPVATPAPTWAEDLEETERGAGGFGSTGGA